MALNWRALVAAIMGGLGVLCVSLGAFEISEAVGLLVTGVMLIVLAVLPDWGA